jgi:hypothetical protein
LIYSLPARHATTTDLAKVRSPTVSSKVALIAITAVLYAVGKGLTAFVPSPWGVGQLLVGIFIPAFFAVTSDTLSVAIGAGLGTFIGDSLLLAPLGLTTPVYSLVAGVPANFIAFLLFGWFVKRYRSWPAFIGATVSFVTLGNLIAATNLVLFLSLPTSLILGFTVFWNTTSIPAIIIAVPILIRAAQPVFGRSGILVNNPDWRMSNPGRQTMVAVVFGVLFLALGVLFFVAAPPSTIAKWPGLTTYYTVAAAAVIIFAPITTVVVGSKRKPAS